MTGMNNTTGQPLPDQMAHIRQSIGDILTTPVGSRVMRRDYGSVLPDLIDHPLNNATLLRLYAATVTAVMVWEPRIRITGISFVRSGDAGAIVEIVGSVGGQQLTTSVQLRG